MTKQRCITKLTLGLMVLAFCAGSQANASFTYTSTPTITSITGGSLGGSSVTLGTVSSATLQTTPTFENLFNVTVSSTTAQPSTDTYTVNFSDTIAITNVPPPGDSATNSLTITGSITFIRSDSGGEVSFLSLTSGQNLSVQVDGQLYTLSQFTYTPPTVNSANGAGNVSALVTSVSVPEPASLALFGLGIVGIGGVMVRRRRTIA